MPSPEVATIITSLPPLFWNAAKSRQRDEHAGLGDRHIEAAFTVIEDIGPPLNRARSFCAGASSVEFSAPHC